jgi:hypothetical protein
MRHVAARIHQVEWPWPDLQSRGKTLIARIEFHRIDRRVTDVTVPWCACGASTVWSSTSMISQQILPLV